MLCTHQFLQQLGAEQAEAPYNAKGLVPVIIHTLWQEMTRRIPFPGK
jgi:hypothetical protein